jgi:hypothetical protein
MTAYEFNQQFAKRVKSERKTTNEILQDINYTEAEKFHLALGFSSIFDWLTRGHGYSGSAAQRRIQASRLLKSVPELCEKLESGETNLTIAAQTQSAFMQSQKLGRKISNEQKAEVVEELTNNNSYEAERKLMTFFPELEDAPQKDSQKVIAHDRSRMTSDLSDETIAIFERVKELLSHKFPEGAMDDILFHIGSDYLDRNDPLRNKKSMHRNTERVTDVRSGHSASSSQPANTYKTQDEIQSQSQSQSQSTMAVDNLKSTTTTGNSRSTAAAVNSCVKKAKAISRSVNRILIQKSNDQCEYHDPVTGRRCSSRYQMETDHIQMRALGGTHAAQNLRRLCRAHNQFLAEQTLGKKWANHWRSKLRE